MLKSKNNHDIIKDIPQSCFDTAAAELKRITCYDIPEPQPEAPLTVNGTNTCRYVIMDGKYYEQCDDCERGIYYRDIGDTECDMTAHIIYETVWQFGINKAAADGLYGSDCANEAALIAGRCFSELPQEYQPYYSRRTAQLQRLKEKGI